ncbi:hypothetical protein JOQ06_003749 [Pogonophryne albipinna]|uniref:Serine/threonine-protein kinase WNK CCTL2 domain-containing protein n=1 Tax=Pogonophryne albipinna TaxID=1090488 RepID=A0AAD6AGC5_9TELE|nr:hypothetical protein JOQ06_003749 [Pogonophryne albipinna]
MPTAAVASPLPLPVGVVPTIVSPPPPAPPPVPTPVPQPLATVVPIISVVTAPPDTPMEAPPQSSELSQSQLQPPQVLSSIESGHSEASGRPTKRHQKRSVRSRSRNEKTSKAKLNVLNISNRGDRVAECQLETHNRKMVTFRFDLDGDNPEEIAQIMVQSEFILESERESFIEQVREVIENADEKGLERDSNSQMAGDMAQQIPTRSVPMPDISPSATAQVVHSAGRRFIVSPVPEARLKEQTLPSSPSPARQRPAGIVPPAAAPAQTPATGLSLSQSAGAISLQQAFSELRQNRDHFDPGPSTAPASIHSTHPPLQPAAATAPPQASSVPPTVDPTAALLPSSFNPPQEQLVKSPQNILQSTLVHSQPQTAALPGQTHTHCGECDARCEAFNESQGKPDDIQALEMKLRSLFMDMGGGGSATGGDLSAADPASGAHAAGTSSPMGPCPTSSTSRPGTPISTPAPIVSTVVPASSFGQTTPSKTPLSRTSASSPPSELLPSFPGPCLTQSQQPLEDLDAQPLTVARIQRDNQLSPPLVIQVELNWEDFRKGKGGDVVDGPPQRSQGGSKQPSPLTSPCPTTTIGRFQVTTSPEARVGRFSVSRAQEQNLESGPTPRPASPAANGPSHPAQVLSPDSTHKVSLPSLNNNSFNNSYISSDNDSEFEDEDFKLEVSHLTEKHMREIQALHSRQKEEIDSLFTKLGKVPPAAVLPPIIGLTGRRRRPTKSKSSKSSRTSSTHSSKSPLQPGSTLSAQSAPTLPPGPLALLAPGGLADSGSSTLLQPLKPSPSSNNVCSACTSDTALSVHSLCAPTPGCVKFSWGSERLAFKPGGRRTRFLSTPCLALWKMVKKVCPCNQLCRTNSTNAVSGSGGLCQSQGGSQSLPPSMSAPHQRKGTFTDDLHKLVDNWARDAMNLSQGKRSAKQLPQAPAQGHSYEVIQSASLGRKFSAPGQLCPSSIGGSAHLPTNSTTATSLAARKGSLCQPPAPSAPPQPQPPQFIHYTPTSAYSAQWSGPSTLPQAPGQPGPLLVSTSQPLGPYPPSLSGQGQIPGQGPLQAFHLTNSLKKSVSNPGGPNLRTT